MHEMSIAQSIIDIVGKEADKVGVSTVNEVELEIGLLAGVEFEALTFALKVMAPDSIIEGVNIVINKPGGLARCFDCSYEFETNDVINICPECRSYGCNIIRGKELRVSSILID